MGSFSEQVSGWCSETEQRLERVWQTAIGDLATELTTTVKNGGRVPHRTGNLANSLLASTAGMPAQGGAGSEYGVAGVDPGALAAQSKLGDTIWMGYRANYARRMNFGFVGEDSLGRTFNQSGFHFVENAVGKWTSIVQAAAEKVKGG